MIYQRQLCLLDSFMSFDSSHVVSHHFPAWSASARRGGYFCVFTICTHVQRARLQSYRLDHPTPQGSEGGDVIHSSHIITPYTLKNFCTRKSSFVPCTGDIHIFVFRSYPFVTPRNTWTRYKWETSKSLFVAICIWSEGGKLGFDLPVEDWKCKDILIVLQFR